MLGLRHCIIPTQADSPKHKMYIKNLQKTKRHANTNCKNCGEPLYIRPHLLNKVSTGHICRPCWRIWNKENNAKYLLKTSPEKKYKFPKGKENPAWKGGLTYRRRKGNYGDVKYVRCREDFMSMARSDGYVMEHRIIVAISLGRSLTRTEVVHHINHDCMDNRLENLMLFANNAEHKRYEHSTGHFRGGNQSPQ